MVHRHQLVQNVAAWDRGIRVVVSILCILGSPLIVTGSWWLALLGALGGTQAYTALTGY